MIVVLVSASAIAVTIETATSPDDGILHRLGRFTGYWLHVNKEHNVPTWCSSVLLAIVALVASDIARVERQLRRTPWWGWAAMTAVFLYLSFDEMSQVHDNVQWLEGLMAPFAIIFAALMVPLLVKLPRPIAWQVALAGVVFVGGSAGMELLSDFVFGTNQLLVHIEEAAELSGTGILLAAIVQYRNLLDNGRLAENREHERVATPSSPASRKGP